MDDQNPMIKYSSGWTRNTNVTYPNGVPYLRSTTGTNVTGSTMQVTFAGTWIRASSEDSPLTFLPSIHRIFFVSLWHASAGARVTIRVILSRQRSSHLAHTDCKSDQQLSVERFRSTLPTSSDFR